MPDEHSGRDHPIEALVQQARVERTQFLPMVDQDFYDRSLDERREAVKARVEAYIAESGESWAKIAKGIDEKASTLSQIVNGHYPEGKTDGFAKHESVLRALDRYIGLQLERREAPPANPIAWTKVAQDIRGIVKMAAVQRCIAAITGPAGIGKTFTLKALAADYSAIVVDIDYGSNTPSKFFRTLHRKMRLRERVWRTDLYEAIVDEFVIGKRMLIVDEADQADMKTLNAIRQLWDATKARGWSCPVILVGMPALRANLQRWRDDEGQGAKHYSRIGVIHDLHERCAGDGGDPLFSLDDIRKMFARDKLRLASDGERWLQQRACMVDDGALRACEQAVNMVAYIERNNAPKPISAEMLAKASRLLLGQQVTTTIEHRIELRKAKVG